MAERVLRWAPIALVSALLVWMVREAARPLRDPDVWWHLRLGHDFLSQGSLGVPAWSSFSDRAWVPTQPLTEVVMAEFQRRFGLPGVAWLFGVGLMAVVLSLYFSARTRGESLASAVSVVVAVLGCSVALSPRPQIVSLALVPVVVAAWLRTADDGRPRWWLAPLIAGWSLCHGFWFVGAGLSVVSAVVVSLDRREGWRNAAGLLGVPALSLVLVALSPVGLGVFEAPFQVSATSHFIVEWQRTDLLSPAALAVAAMAVVTVGAWLLVSRRPTLLEVCLLAIAIVLLWYSQRTVALAAGMLAPLLAGGLQSLIRGRTAETVPVSSPSRRERLSLLVTSALCAVLLAAVVGRTSADPGHVPTGMDARLDALPPSTAVFDWYTVGGWLAWRHPDLQRYVDGLTDAYSTAHLERYQRLTEAAPGSQSVLREQGLRVALLPAGNALAKALELSGWMAVSRDGGYVLLEAPANGG